MLPSHRRVLSRFTQTAGKEKLSLSVAPCQVHAVLITVTARLDEEKALLTDERRGLDEILLARDVARESRNFWKWLAVASWIFIGLAAVLTLIPFR